MEALYEDFLVNSHGRKLVFFGASVRGFICMNNYPGKVYAFSDNDKNKWGTDLNGIKVCSPEELLKEADDVVIVITSVYFDEISCQLKGLGFKHVYPYTVLYHKLLNCINFFTTEHIGFMDRVYHDGSMYHQANVAYIVRQNLDNIAKVRSLLSDEKSRRVYDFYINKIKRDEYTGFGEVKEEGKQYFPDGVFDYAEDEVFVDAGCFDGKSSMDFAEAVNYKFSEIHCFEPDEGSHKRCEDALNSLDYMKGRVALYKAGLSDENVDGYFYELGSGMSHVRSEIPSSGKIIPVKLLKLDSVINSSISFIKMDIEGEELKALKGASETIKKYKPKLAICIYHKIADAWEIPLYIKELVPEYRFYIRHYSPTNGENVLYATI